MTPPLMAAIHPKSVDSARTYAQNCATTGACRVPFEDRDAETLLRYHTPSDPGKNYQPGHLKPLGHSSFESLWDGAISVASAEMDPETFWSSHHGREPLLFAGAGTKHPAFSKWTSDDYIISNFGHFKAKIEHKNEDRLIDYCGQERRGQEIECDEQELKPYQEVYKNISAFIKQQYKESDEYVISQLPGAMSRDVQVLPAWYCGRRSKTELQESSAKTRPWMTQLLESNLWINYNYGRNFSSSVIHYDMNHQMMCLYDGRKEWIFFDLAKYAEDIPMWGGYYDKEAGFASESDDSPIDGESVDLERYPSFVRARWRNATMRAGDCLYLPPYHLHYVRSFGRNVAGMYMMTPDISYSEAQCDEAPARSTPLNEFDIVWDFPGQEGAPGYDVVKMGWPEWKSKIREPLVEFTVRRHKGRLGKEAFVVWHVKMREIGEEDEEDEEDEEKHEEKDEEDETQRFLQLHRARRVWIRDAERLFDTAVRDREDKILLLADLYNHPLLQNVYQDIAVGWAGNPQQDLDTVLSRYNLVSKGKAEALSKIEL